MYLNGLCACNEHKQREGLNEVLSRSDLISRARRHSTDNARQTGFANFEILTFLAKRKEREGYSI